MTREYVTVTTEHVEKAQAMLAHLPGQSQKVLARALNRALENARSNTVKSARDEYQVKATEVRKTLKITRATSTRLQAVVSSRGMVLPLSAFSVKPKTPNGRRRTPIRVGVQKGSAEALRNAFIARVGGRLGVYERVGKARLPIKQLYGPSVPQMIGNNRVIGDIAEKARQTMDVRLDHEISRVLNEGSGR